MNFFLRFFLSFATSVCGCLVASAETPNIVFILADDMGYGDVQALNPNSKIPTPNLNRLAKEGMTFTDAHTGSAVCTPTRYGLVTGRYCWRSKLKRGVLNGYSSPLIENDRPTVATILGSANYHCGIVGKWHLGLGFASNEGKKDAQKKPQQKFDYSKMVAGPNQLGFDHSYVIPASLDFPPYVYIQNGKVTAEPTESQPAQKFPAFLRNGPRSPDFIMEDALDHLVQQSQKFLKQRSQAKDGKPFLLYFPLTAPHKPVLPHPRFQGKSKLGPYGDFVMQVDWSVGEILKTLDESGLAKNTIVFYSSDNGSFMYRTDDVTEGHVQDESIQSFRQRDHTANGLFRGTKADIYEAGHHVPFFVRWPGHIAPGSKCEDPICLTDFAATAAEIANAKIPSGAAEDSFSFLNQLNGKKPLKARPPVIHHSANGMFAVRDGNWKLILGDGSGGRENPRGQPFKKPYQLYDLANDLGEKNNLAKKNPEMVEKLTKVVEELRTDD